MAANTVSVYLRSPLFENVKAAQADKTINVNEVCSEALRLALNLDEEMNPLPPPKPGVLPTPVPEISMEDIQRAAAQMPINEPEAYQYEMTFVNDMTAAQAFLDNMSDNGGYPVSMCVDPIGRVGFLSCWPKDQPAVIG